MARRDKDQTDIETPVEQTADPEQAVDNTQSSDEDQQTGDDIVVDEPADETDTEQEPSDEVTDIHAGDLPYDRNVGPEVATHADASPETLARVEEERVDLMVNSHQNYADAVAKSFPTKD